MSEREQASDPYAVRLEPGEEVVRSGYAHQDNRGKYRNPVGLGYTSNPCNAQLFDTAALAWEYRAMSGEPVHITVIATPERREPAEWPSDLKWAWEMADGTFANVYDRPTEIGRWRPIRIIPGHERAVVRRLVPGPEVETNG